MNNLRNMLTTATIVAVSLSYSVNADSKSALQSNSTTAVKYTWSAYPERRLQDDGYELTENGLRRALDSTDNWIKISAIRVIRKQAMKSLLTEVGNQLTNSWCPVRVEAGMTLLELGDPKGSVALHKEVAHGVAIVQDVLSGKRGALGTMPGDNDVKKYIEAAGALADVGDSSEFALVKTTIQSFPRTGYAWTAARILPKFAKFKQQSKDIDVVALLLVAADDTIKAIEDTPKDGKKDEYSFHGGSMMIIARSLAEVGGSEARAKLLQISQHTDPAISQHGKNFLNALDKKSAPPSNMQKTP